MHRKEEGGKANSPGHLARPGKTCITVAHGGTMAGVLSVRKQGSRSHQIAREKTRERGGVGELTHVKIGDGDGWKRWRGAQWFAMTLMAVSRHFERERARGESEM